MKSRFISRRLVGSLMLSMAGVFALSALPAQAATKEEAVVKQLQKEILQCPVDLTMEKRILKQLKQIGFRETFRADASDPWGYDGSPDDVVVMERETPILFLGHPTKKFALLLYWTGAGVPVYDGLDVAVVLPKSSFDAVKKYQRGGYEDKARITVSQEDDGVYLTCSFLVFLEGEK